MFTDIPIDHRFRDKWCYIDRDNRRVIARTYMIDESNETVLMLASGWYNKDSRPGLVVLTNRLTVTIGELDTLQLQDFRADTVLQ